jgi:hypothetical protein
MTKGMIFGGLLVGAGVAVSMLAWMHDLGRMRISLSMPQAAPSRVPPELHAVAAVLNAVGWLFLRGWIVAGIVLVAHMAVAWGLAPFVVERLAFWFRKSDR